MRPAGTLAAAAVLALSACGETASDTGKTAGPGPDGGTLAFETDCARAACPIIVAVAESIGCAVVDPTQCTCPDACTAVTKAYFECVAKDESQCLCETSGDLNCEGSFKPDEGPALCIAEAMAANDCIDREEGAADQCAAAGEDCSDNDCCSGLFCVSGICASSPRGCVPLGESCADNDCCDGLACTTGAVCRSAPTCAESGESCADNDCCDGLACRSSVCAP